MKTYNTIEDILNDHELMANDVFEIGEQIFLKGRLNYDFKNVIKQIKGRNIWRKAKWLKSEYERRQKEKTGEQSIYKEKFISHDGTNQHFAEPIMTAENFNKRYESLTNPVQNKKLNLIPFDLEKAKAGAKVWQDATAPKEAKIISVKGQDRFPLLALIKREDGIEYIAEFTLQGNFYKERIDERNDLFIESEQLPELWANLYQRQDGTFFTGSVYKSEKEAVEGIKNKGDFHKHIKTIKL